MNNANISAGKKKARKTIKTREKDIKKNCGNKVKEKDKNQHTWKIFWTNALKKNKTTHKLS